MVPVHEKIREHRHADQDDIDSKIQQARKVQLSDFLIHMKRINQVNSDLNQELTDLSDIVNSLLK